jgi:beta-glucosidase
MSVTFPEGFVWGVAAASHQIEGGNSNNDWWAFEHKPDTPCVEPSGDCTNSFHLYPDDIALVRDHGFGAYRFSIEWSRIEPEDGEFSIAALDYYRRVLAACHEQGVQPVVTFHHFSNPRWVAGFGGWESPQVVDRFTRYCERTVAHIGDLISIGCTINEPNILSLMGYVRGAFPPGRTRDHGAYSAVNANLVRAHRSAYDVLKAGRGDFPVGLCVAMGDWWSTDGVKEKLARARHTHEGQFLEAARGDDFVGVQAYSRTRMDETGFLGPEEGVEVVSSMSYEFWPQSLEVAIRFAAETAQTPLYVTENGLGHEDDTRRIAYVTEALEGVGRCLADGIDVRGYFYWSLLDNFEWALGYGPKFGLVSVTRDTFVRTPKPSAAWLGAIARANRMDS